MHPYRQPRAPRSDDAADAEDTEERIVHAVLCIVGAIGILDGAIHQLPTELSIGGLFCAFALRGLWGRARRVS